ncbi:hypothetical protein C0J52_00978 [Blattella germanica]|nr:hypothetical protein C0J52_00978 [Blattella germanica]
MAEPEVKRRMENHQKRTSVIRSAVAASGFQHLIPQAMENPTRKPVKRSKCASSPREKDNQTNQICHNCGDFNVSRECRKSV